MISFNHHSRAASRVRNLLITLAIVAVPLSASAQSSTLPA